MKTVIGVLLGVGIGAACRWFDVPVPAPPRLLGAILVLSLTAGYVAADRLLVEQESDVAERETTVAERVATGPGGDAVDDAPGRPGG